MRAVGLLSISAWLIMAAVGRAETKFPYQVTIPAGFVELRSGPGLAFYATDRLSAGDRIEVFREEKVGWLAVAAEGLFQPRGTSPTAGRRRTGRGGGDGR